jgi:hypothetical protein
MPPRWPLRHTTLVRLGPTGQVLGLGRADQLHRQPARLQDEEPDPPVVAGRLQRDDLDAVLTSWRPSARMAFIRALTVHTVATGGRARTGAGCGAHHPGVLGHIDRGHPTKTRLCSWSSITCGLLTAATSWAWPIDTASCPGVPDGGHQARNTDRRTRGNTARPSGQDPRQASLRARIPKCANVTGSPPYCPPPAHRHKPRPGCGSSPARPRPAPDFTHRPCPPFPPTRLR